jgi:hypothetical protein
LVAVSVQDLSPGPQDNSEFYLENIYLLLADPNVSRASILAGPAKPPPFSPPTHAIWVNSLWFLSLAISLTCALLATLLQQWARRYLTVTQQPRYSPHKRARICAFLADGVDKFHVPWAVETLPTLLHLSLFLFFCGLLIFLFNIHHTVFSVVVWWVGFSVVVYGCITLVPIFRPDSPYYAPLSSAVLIVYTGVSYGVFRILAFITLSNLFSVPTWEHFDNLRDTYRKRLWWGVVKTAQETASASLAEIDRRVLRRTIEALDEDHELEQFIECIPGFCSSEEVEDPKRILAEMDDEGLTDTLIRFWNNTRTSSIVSETLKKKRIMTCVRVADLGGLSRAAWRIHGDIFGRGMDEVLRSVEIGHSLGTWGNNNNEGSALCAQGIVSGIIAIVPVGERDDQWKALVKNQLGVSEDVLRDYLAHGDSVLFANLIHITRQFFRSYLVDGDGYILLVLPSILASTSRFDIQNTVPGLQNDFCALWNEIVFKAQITGNSLIPYYILRDIRHIYIVLHQGTDSAPTAFSPSTHDNDDILFQPSSYPVCNIPGHASHTVIGPPEESAHASNSAATLPTVPHPDPILTTISPSAGPDMSPSPTFTPHPSRIRLADEPSLHDIPQATTTNESSHLTPPLNLENNQFPAISLESATAAATECPVDTSTVSEFDLHPTLAASTSIAQLLATPTSSSTVAEKHNVNFGVVPHSVLPFSSFSIPAPGNLLPADPQAAQASPRSQIDQLIPNPGFPPSSVTASSFTTPQATSVSHPSTASNDGVYDTHDNSRAPGSSNIIGVPHHPHQLAVSVPDIATEVSRRSFDTVPSSSDTDRPEER